MDRESERPAADRNAVTASDVLIATLRRLMSDAFPKSCHCCGRRYEDLDEFLEATAAAERGRGLLDVNAAGDQGVIDFVRTCPCGSSLHVVTAERRETSGQGGMLRETFGQLLERLVQDGVPEEVARGELIRCLHGEDSALLREHGIDPSLDQG